MFLREPIVAIDFSLRPSLRIKVNGKYFVKPNWSRRERVAKSTQLQSSERSLNLQSLVEVRTNNIYRKSGFRVNKDIVDCPDSYLDGSSDRRLYILDGEERTSREVQSYSKTIPSPTLPKKCLGFLAQNHSSEMGQLPASTRKGHITTFLLRIQIRQP